MKKVALVTGSYQGIGKGIADKLKKEGYTIESSTNKGYRLVGSIDALFPNEIKWFLDTEFIGKEIIFLDSIDSTNNYAKKKAARGFEDGTIIIAEKQTSGRGRLGREWKSSIGKGIWMTIMLKPRVKPEKAAQLTLMTAYAVNKSIRNICGLESYIKWPNDIVINGKKACGILTEMGAEIDRINYLLVGIGINANTEPEIFAKMDLNHATSLKIEKDESIDRKLLVVDILKNFEDLYYDFVKSGSIRNIIEDYKKVSATLGKEVKLLTRSEELFGLAIDMTCQGELMVLMDSGEMKKVSSGEVSIRAKNGYV